MIPQAATGKGGSLTYLPAKKEDISPDIDQRALHNANCYANTSPTE
jgi:hypothetical protein